MERNPNVRAASNCNPRELRKSDADYRERNLVDGNCATDDRGVGTEAITPVTIAEDRYRGIRPVFTRREERAVLRRDSEYREEIVGVGIALREAARPT